jgi:hypothetical protein
MMEQPIAQLSIFDTSPPPAGILANICTNEPDGDDADIGCASSIRDAAPATLLQSLLHFEPDLSEVSPDVAGDAVASVAPRTENDQATWNQVVQAGPARTIGTDNDTLQVTSPAARDTSDLAAAGAESTRMDEHRRPSREASSDVEPVTSLRGGFFWLEFPPGHVEPDSSITNNGEVRDAPPNVPLYFCYGILGFCSAFGIATSAYYCLFLR